MAPAVHAGGRGKFLGSPWEARDKLTYGFPLFLWEPVGARGSPSELPDGNPRYRAGTTRKYHWFSWESQGGFPATSGGPSLKIFMGSYDIPGSVTRSPGFSVWGFICALASNLACKTGVRFQEISYETSTLE